MTNKEIDSLPIETLRKLVKAFSNWRTEEEYCPMVNENDGYICQKYREYICECEKTGKKKMNKEDFECNECCGDTNGCPLDYEYFKITMGK